MYVPHKNDPIDSQLAYFINHQSDLKSLKILFTRFSEGIYNFGTRRVNLKLENNALKVRVGGGYLNLEDFVDQYTPIEKEKLVRDPERRMAEIKAQTIDHAGIQVPDSTI